MAQMSDKLTDLAVEVGLCFTNSEDKEDEKADPEIENGRSMIYEGE